MRWMTRTGKYNARKVTVDRHTFDSQLEADYYCHLMLLKKAKLIIKIELQPEFCLQPEFKYHGKGRTIRPICYVGDFLITYPDGHKECHDTKGIETEVFKLKRKMFMFRYPEVELKIIKRGDF